MFKGHWILKVMEEEADSMLCMAITHNLKASHKLGIYGEYSQHELLLEGSIFNYIRFINNLKRRNTIKNNTKHK